MRQKATPRARRLIAATALAVVSAATLPAAAAAERPDDRAGLLGVGGTASTQVSPARPDDRAGSLGIGAIAASTAQPAEPVLASHVVDTTVRPDDAAGPRGPGAVPTGPLGRWVFAPGSSSFRWGDAALGALTTAGLLLLASAIALIVRFRQRFVLH